MWDRTETHRHLGKGPYDNASGMPQLECCPNRGVPLPQIPGCTCAVEKHTAPISNVALEGTGKLLPYVDINPHKTGPKWPAYVGLAVLLVATIAVVALALTTH